METFCFIFFSMYSWIGICLVMLWKITYAKMIYVLFSYTWVRYIKCRTPWNNILLPLLYVCHNTSGPMNFAILLNIYYCHRNWISEMSGTATIQTWFQKFPKKSNFHIERKKLYRFFLKSTKQIFSPQIFLVEEMIFICCLTESRATVRSC